MVVASKSMSDWNVFYNIYEDDLRVYSDVITKKNKTDLQVIKKDQYNAILDRQTDEVLLISIKDASYKISDNLDMLDKSDIIKLAKEYIDE